MMSCPKAQAYINFLVEAGKVLGLTAGTEEAGRQRPSGVCHADLIIFITMAKTTKHYIYSYSCDNNLVKFEWPYL